MKYLYQQTGNEIGVDTVALDWLQVDTEKLSSSFNQTYGVQHMTGKQQQSQMKYHMLRLKVYEDNHLRTLDFLNLLEPV